MMRNKMDVLKGMPPKPPRGFPADMDSMYIFVLPAVYFINSISFLLDNGITHKFIRPRTPEHNGKVERSHRIDQEKFYRTLRFHSLDDLRSQGARWNRRCNEMPRMVLKLKSPNQVELEKLMKLMQDTGEARCPKLIKRFTSIDN